MKNLIQYLDFTSGHKTITGLAVMLLPLITTYLGVDITETEVTANIDTWFQVIGSALAVYGLAVKACKGTLEIYYKFK